MLMGRQLHGLRVKDHYRQRSLGQVNNIIIDHSGTILGFIIDSDKILSKKLYLPVKGVKKLSLNGLFIDKNALQKLPGYGEKALDWCGRLIFDHKGSDIGSVSDVMLDGYKLTGIEVSSGILGDLYSGRQIVSWDSIRSSNDRFVEIDNFIKG